MFGCPECKNCKPMGLIPDIAPTYSSGTNQASLPAESSWWEQLSDWGSSAIADLGKYVNEAKEIMNKGMDYTYEKVNEARELMQEAESKRIAIDQKIESMPPGPDRDRLIAKRDQAKGFFDEYVLPAWIKFASLVGLNNNPASSYNNMTFGYVQAIAISVVIVALALSAVAWKYIELQDDILTDPAFSTTQKAGLLTSFSVGGLTANLKPIAIAGAVIAVAIFVIPRFVSKKNG